jgi:hypothetical protein
MGQRSNDAAVQDAQIKSSKEECASSMEQITNNAALKDAQIIPNEEDYAGDMAHTAILMKILLLLHRALDPNLKRLLLLTPLLSVLQQVL